MGLFIKKKSEVLEKITELKALIENAYRKKIKILRSDNGREYISNELLHICSQIGIHIQHSIPYTPQQSSVAERKNRSLKEMTTYMLESKKLAANLWAEAMHATAYIQNRVPHSYMKGKTPFEAYFRHKLDMSNLRVFGSTAWSRIRLIKGGIRNHKASNICLLDILMNLMVSNYWISEQNKSSLKETSCLMSLFKR